MTTTAKDTFEKIVALTEEITSLMDTFGGFDVADQESVLGEAFEAGIAELGEEDEVPITLIRCAEMLVGVMTENVVKILCKGLAHENPTVRLLSGDAITHVAEESLQLLKPAIDDILSKGGTAAEEMPFILSELEDPEVVDILKRFLAHESAEVVASAIEGLIELGDPDAAPALEALVDDGREVSVDDASDAGETTTVGQLAKDALDILQNEE